MGLAVVARLPDFVDDLEHGVRDVRGDADKQVSRGGGHALGDGTIQVALSLCGQIPELGSGHRRVVDDAT
ncbi:hypothetical protein GCM10009765_15780 [Fodinicola feengrottensis]|uniref:Uncharacterized protein n=1 Tax=Fodinicola feengrottensis TaxID=435914 RepID=A0ABN2G8H0_9ACTN